MRRDLADIIADLFHRIADLERRVQSVRRTGTIEEVDAAKGVARVKLGQDPKTGKPYLSPWMPWTMPAMGATKINIPPSVGQQVEIVSESGDMTEAIINASLRSNANPQPGAEPGDMVIVNTGKVVFKTPSFHVEAGNYRVDAGSVDVAAGKIAYTKSGSGGAKPGAAV